MIFALIFEIFRSPIFFSEKNEQLVCQLNKSCLVQAVSYIPTLFNFVIQKIPKNTMTKLYTGKLNRKININILKKINHDHFQESACAHYRNKLTFKCTKKISYTFTFIVSDTKS